MRVQSCRPLPSFAVLLSLVLAALPRVAIGAPDEQQVLAARIGDNVSPRILSERSESKDAQAKQQSQPAAPPDGGNADAGWPRTVTLKSGTVVWYQPQIESWTGQKRIVAWSAVEFTPTGAKKPVLGTIKIEGDTYVALDDRLVSMELRVTEYNFKSLSPEQVKALVADVQALPQQERVLDLDRLMAYTAASPLQQKNAKDVKADPPKIYAAEAPAILVDLDGEPIWSPIEGLDLKYAVNTNWDLFEHAPSGALYLRYDKSWLQSAALAGPWTPAERLPDSFKKLPADDNWKDVKAALPGKKLSQDKMPKVFVSTEPAELIVTDGPLKYAAVDALPNLLWVSNTESDLFRMGESGDFYFLVAGRWFKASSLDGRWSFATPSLPDEFKKIPVEHPRSRVLASVPGTEQATEAVVLATIPRTARVNKKEVKAPEVIYQGEPEFKAIEGTKGLERAVNTDKDIVKSGESYYLCYQGVWFVAPSAKGPWEVASSVPQPIYDIPASSPVHYVTYVTVEDHDPNDEWVTVGYVAAYTGVMIAWGCAVWGTGWYYPPYHWYGGFHPVYYGYPHTYGMGAWYNPYSGAYGRGTAAYGPYGGIGMGASYNPHTGTYARGAAAYGPYGSRSFAQAYNPRTGAYGQTRQGSNVYGNWGTSSVQRGDQWAQTAHAQNYQRGTSASGMRTSSGGGAVSRTGPAGDRTTVGRTGSGDVYAGRDGNVYRRSEGGGWQQSDGAGGWSQVERTGESPQGADARQGTGASGIDRSAVDGQLDRDRSARESGNQRAANRDNWQSSGRSRGAAGSFGGGRGGGGGRRR